MHGYSNKKISTSLKLCIIGKYPPIQGGVSRYMYWLARRLAELGHQIYFVTNANEVELDYQMYIPAEEQSNLECSFSNGGLVKLYMSQESGSDYIPYANPFASKLASIAFDVVKNHHCSFIYTSYLEPYGFAGALVSKWAGVPYSVQHAGSDIGRLAQKKDRSSAYLQVMKQADLVFTARNSVRHLIASGIDYEKILLGTPNYLSDKYFTPKGPVLDINEFIQKVHKTKFSVSLLKEKVFDLSKPTIGIYGKVGKYKGIFELIKALGLLKKSGKEFNFIALCGSAGQGVEELKLEIGRQELEDYTYILPYIPHWLVPQFIRACTAICFLENRFPIPIHRPQVPREVLACGRCLILSQEICDKQPDSKDFIDGTNCFIIPDPQDIQYLSNILKTVIDKPEYAKKIGSDGYKLFHNYENNNSYLNLIEKISKIVEFKQEQSMSLFEFQRFLVNLYTDASFRELFNNKSDEAFEYYSLNPSEVKALDQLRTFCNQELERFTASLYRKKFFFLWKQFNLLNQVFSDLEIDLLKAFKKNYDFYARNWIEDINYFADFLIDYVSNNQTINKELFKDIVRYDRLMRIVSFQPLPHENIENINQLSSTNHKYLIENIMNIAVFKSPYTITENFNYKVPTIGSVLEIDKLTVQPSTFAFVPSLNKAKADVYYLSPSLKYLIERANQPILVHELINESAKFHKIDTIQDDFKKACLKGIMDLVSQRVFMTLVKS